MAIKTDFKTIGDLTYDKDNLTHREREVSKQLDEIRKDLKTVNDAIDSLKRAMNPTPSPATTGTSTKASISINLSKIQKGDVFFSLTKTEHEAIENNGMFILSKRLHVPRGTGTEYFIVSVHIGSAMILVVNNLPKAQNALRMMTNQFDFSNRSWGQALSVKEREAVRAIELLA